MRTLIVEDDERLGRALSDVLRLHGFTVDLVPDAAGCLRELRPDTDVVVLDLGLPDRDGFELCARIRREHQVPIIIATARSDLPSRVHGLHLGADDYLVKPYDVRELLARIRAVTRRVQARAPSGPPGSSGPHPLDPIDVGPVRIDPARRVVSCAGSPIPLTRKEFDLIALLAEHRGVVVRREQLLSEVWQTSWGSGGRTLEVHVASIRAKTGLAGIIETVRGVGYRLGTA
jgi:DNA-binding response OmpR family regulator